MRFSVITICYNDSKLSLTCRSIAEQTDRDFEWIVIDGASGSETQNLLSRFRPLMAHFVSEPDDGIYDAMNKGVLLAKGEFLIFMNAGDRFASADTLSILKGLMDQADPADVYYANGVFEDSVGRHFLMEKPSHLTEEFLFFAALFHQAMAIRRTAFLECGLYDSSLKIAADWKHYVIMFKRGYKFRHLPFVMAIDDNGGVSSTADGKQERPCVLHTLFTKEECRAIQRIKVTRLMDFLRDQGRLQQLRGKE